MTMACGRKEDTAQDDSEHAILKPKTLMVYYNATNRLFNCENMCLILNETLLHAACTH